jgi:uncharacterized membrane protein
LPLSVEDAMRLLVSGGVIAPQLLPPKIGEQSPPVVLEGSGPAAEAAADRAVRAAG